MPIVASLWLRAPPLQEHRVLRRSTRAVVCTAHANASAARAGAEAEEETGLVLLEYSAVKETGGVKLLQRPQVVLGGAVATVAA